MQRICKACGKRFEGRNDATLCADCAAASKASSIIRKRVCQACGKTFDGGPRAWYCPECREERKKAQSREAKQRARMGKTRKIGSDDICVVCGKTYTVEAGNQKYCPNCAPEAIKEIGRAQSRKWNRDNVDVSARREERKAAAAPIKCVICGKKFIPHDSSITCSPDCSAELSRRNTSAAEKARRKERNEYHKARLKAKEQAMTPEEYAEYRRRINEKARENYKKRKEAQEKGQ